jgi:hypothetical protein
MSLHLRIVLTCASAFDAPGPGAGLLAQVHVRSQECSNPKALEAAVGWVCGVAEQFGIAAADHFALIQLAHEWLQSSLAQVVTLTRLDACLPCVREGERGLSF